MMTTHYRLAITKAAVHVISGPNDFITERFCDEMQRISDEFDEPYDAVVNDVVKVATVDI